MRKYFYFILFWIIPESIIFAQQIYPDQNYVNQAKYWFYRNRLVNEFCKVGPNLGESLPVQSVNYVTKYIEVGDGSIQKLGHYIGVLATEYKLLKNSNQSTENTLRELYYALNAVKRLDQNAETYDYCYDRDEVQEKEGTLYPMYTNCVGNHNPTSQDLISYYNGFLNRTDIDPRNGNNDPFISPIHKWFNNMTGDTLIGSDFGAIIPGYGKDKGGVNHQGLSIINDMSHDQVNHLLIGFRLVQQMLVGTETFDPGSGSGPVFLKAFAKEIITKIVLFMKDGSAMSDANCMYLQSFSSIQWNKDLLNWFLNPAPGALCGANSPFVQIKNGAIHVPWLFENPVIDQPASIFASPGASFPYYMIQGYAATGSILTGIPQNMFDIGSIPPAIWKRLASKIPVQAHKLSDGIKILTLVALSNSWQYPCTTIPCFKDICIIPTPWGCLLKIKNFPIPGTVCAVIGECESSKDRLNEQAYQGYYEILPLLNNVLFGTYGYKYYDYESFFQSHINSAPCRGPYCYGLGNKSDGDWSSWNMFITPNEGEAPERNLTTNLTDLGEYNGLDYMLMYNLYNIYHGKNDYYVNYDNNLNLSNRSVVDKKEFYNARAYKENGVYYNGNITASTFTVSQNGYAEFRAGSSIDLTPGFSVSAGSEFSATIYRPTNNWEWEMTVCSSFDPQTGIPNGHRKSSQRETESVDEIHPVSDTYLGNCYPNPTADITVIPYVIAEEGIVEISVVDRFGQIIASPVSKQHHETGKFTIEYNTSGLSPGVYHYILKSGNHTETKKMMIIK